MHWRRKWQPTPVFLPGESQGRGSLVGCRLWGRTGLDMTEVTWQAMKSFLYAWAQQNYVLMLVDKGGLLSCLQKRTSTHCLDCLLPCPFMRTMLTLPKL